MERYELPDDWEWKTLGDFCHLERGITFPASSKSMKPGEDLTPCLRTANVQDTVDWDDLIYVPRSYVKSESKKLKQNDILISMANSLELVGKVSYVEDLRFASTFGGFISAVRVNDDMLPKFAFYYFRTQAAIQHLRESSSRSVNIANLSIDGVKSISIPYPPLPEQQRIVSKIESLFEQSRTARTALTRVPVLMSQFRRAVLASAFRGELVEPDPNDEPATSLLGRIREAREQSGYKKSIELMDTSDLPELPEGWMWTSLGELLVKIEAGHSFKSHGRPAQEGEFGVIKVSAMTWGKFLPQENKALLPNANIENVPRVCKDDLLISRANTVQLVGAVVLVDQDYPNLLLSDKSLRLVPVSKDISKKYLLYALRSEQVRRVFETQATGVSESMRNISQGKIQSAPIPLPPLNMQKRVVTKIETLLGKADIIEQAASVSLRRAEQVDQSILARAFRGELG